MDGNVTAHDSLDGAREWLTPDETAADTLIALHHRQRYVVAAELMRDRRVVDLCCGSGYGTRMLARTASHATGVDLSDEALELARAGGGQDVSFVKADALEWVRRASPDDVDGVVCLEGLEHLPDPEEVVVQLARLVAAGVRVLVSLPNSKGFGEENAFHLTDFGYEEVRALLDRLGPDVGFYNQFLAEGALILPLDDERPGTSTAALATSDALLEPRWASHWLAVAGASHDEVDEALLHLRVAAEPNHNSYMRALEQANRELQRTNVRLARRHLGKHDAAAASVVHRFQRRVEDAEAALAAKEAEATALREQLASAVDAAKQNDLYFQDARRQLSRPEHRLLLGVRGRVSRLPPVRIARWVSGRRRADGRRQLPG